MTISNRSSLIIPLKGKAQRYHKLLYEENKNDKKPNVIKVLEQEFDLGEQFGINEIKECGNLKSFYNYYNIHSERFGANRSPRNRRAGEKKMYWFK